MKAKAAKAAIELSATKAAQANKAIAALRTAELALTSAQAKLLAATRALDVVKTPEAAERAASIAGPDARVGGAAEPEAASAPHPGRRG